MRKIRRGSGVANVTAPQGDVHFCHSVVMRGDEAFFGAQDREYDGMVNAGYVAYYYRDQTTWVSGGIIPVYPTLRQTGLAVIAASDDFLAISDDFNVTLFQRSNTSSLSSWDLLTVLDLPLDDTPYSFKRSVCLDGNRHAVAGETPNGFGSFAVFDVYQLTDDATVLYPPTRLVPGCAEINGVPGELNN